MTKKEGLKREGMKNRRMPICKKCEHSVPYGTNLLYCYKALLNGIQSHMKVLWFEPPADCPYILEHTLKKTFIQGDKKPQNYDRLP